MVTIPGFKLEVLFAVFLLLVSSIPATAQGSAVDFSGKVVKIDSGQKKVSIVDPQNKRFTLIIDGKTQLNGFRNIEELKKDDALAGKYVVNEKGQYIASNLTRK